MDSMVYPVDIILPETWRGRVKYRLHQALMIGGVFIPQGFITDGATVPRLFWAVFPPVCLYFSAAIVHDYLLKSGASWKVANRHFRSELKALGIKWWRRKAMGASVAIYGWYKELRVKGG